MTHGYKKELHELLSKSLLAKPTLSKNCWKYRYLELSVMSWIALLGRFITSSLLCKLVLIKRSVFNMLVFFFSLFVGVDLVPMLSCFCIFLSSCTCSPLSESSSKSLNNCIRSWFWYHLIFGIGVSNETLALTSNKKLEVLVSSKWLQTCNLLWKSSYNINLTTYAADLFYPIIRIHHNNQDPSCA